MKNVVLSPIGPSKFIGKSIPQVTAKRFQLTKEYFDEMYKLTNSPYICQSLAN